MTGRDLNPISLQLNVNIEKQKTADPNVFHWHTGVPVRAPARETTVPKIPKGKRRSRPPADRSINAESER